MLGDLSFGIFEGLFNGLKLAITILVQVVLFKQIFQASPNSKSYKLQIINYIEMEMAMTLTLII